MQRPGTRFARFRQPSIVASLLVSLALGASASARAETNDTSLAWVPPTQTRIVAFTPDAPQSGAPVEVDPEKPIRLEPGKVLLIPVDPGDRLRLEGPIEAVGLGSGVHEGPDVITWLPLPAPLPETGSAEARLIAIPTWTMARFLVVRTAKPAEIAVRTASLLRTAMPWHRLDEDVVRFLRDPKARAPTTDIPEAKAILRYILSAASALERAPRAAVADWLTTRWLEASLAYRPLTTPFFEHAAVTLSGGRDARGIKGLYADPSLSPPRVVLSTRGARALSAARIAVDAPDADVARVVVQARGLGVARARVYVGDTLVREILWDVALRTADQDRWTQAQILRVPLPVGARRVVVEVLQGEVAVAASAFRKRPDVLDLIPKERDRQARLSAQASLPDNPAATNLLRLVGIADQSARKADIDAAKTAAEKDDVPSAMRALVLGEAVRWATTPDEALHAAERAHNLSRALPVGTSGAVLRLVMERLSVRYADTLPPPRPWERPLPEAADPDDIAALAALRGILSPPEDGRRPELAPGADRFASEHGDDPFAAVRARQTWVREAPWDTLDPPPGVAVWNEIGVPVDTYGDSRCSVVGSRGLRWTVLGEGRTEINVLPPPVLASHARILVLPGQTEPLPESLLSIDGVSATAHTGAGLGTTVAVTPGLHVFERPQGAAPLYARILRDGVVPCESLRELTRWARLNGTARYRILDAGRATVARVVVYAAGSVARKPRTLRVLVGDRIYEAWVSAGASGAMEVPVPADVSDIEIETTEETLVRVSARMHNAPKPPPRVTTAGVQVSPEARSLLLARVRDATRELDGGPLASRESSRKKRADALEALGFPALAALDRGEDPALEALEDPSAPVAQALALPQGSPSVVPLGLLPKIPPLPLPTDLKPLTDARLAEATGDASTALGVLTRGNARASTDADGLLYAVLTERTGAGFVAADVFERIGLVHRSGPALARAASLSADRASDDQDRKGALRAFVLAQLASELGDPASHAFARLAPAVGWLAVARADSAAGTGLVDVRGPKEPMPLGVAVRRALLDAHEDALLLAEGQHVELRLKQSKPSVVGIKNHCVALEGDPLCQLSVLLDGEEMPCGPSDPTSSHARCSVDVPRGSHRLEVRPPKDRTVMGSVDLSSTGGFAIEPRVVSEWFEVDADRPLELSFMAPTVVRLHARGPAGERLTLPWSIASASKKGARLEGEIALDPAPDPSAHLVGGDPSKLAPLSAEQERRIGVLAEGAHTLRVASPNGRALLRLELAIPVGLPKPRRLPAVKRLANPPSVEAAPPLRMRPEVGFDRDPGPLTVGVYGRYLNLDVDDEDGLTGKSFFELGVRGYRSIETISGFTSLATFVRERIGAPSYGAAGWLDIAPNGWIPGVFLRGRIVGQLLPEGFVLSPRGTIGPLWTIAVNDSFSLVPWAGFSALAPNLGKNEKSDDVDREVWTQYSENHKWYASLGLRSVFRIAVDGFASVGLSARTTEALAVWPLDRVDLTSQVQMLPGRGLWPWLNLGLFMSYRPEGLPYRKPEYEILRTGLEGKVAFWNWIAAGHRVLGGAETRVFWDFGRETSPFRLAGGIFFEYDYTGGRGLRDLPPRDAPFRARLEEGSGRIDRRAPSTDPTWATPP